MFNNVIVGVILVLSGALMRVLRLRRNYLIGYRTPASMRDEESWIFANKLAGKFMIVIGLLSTLSGFANSYFEFTSYQVIIAVTFGMLVLAIVLIEIRLKKRASR